MHTNLPAPRRLLTSWRALFVGLALVACTAADSHAQGWSLDAVGARSGTESLGNMFGLGFTSTNPIGRSRGLESLQLSGFLVRGAHPGFGSPCAGLIRPGTCLPQPLRITSGLGAISIGLARRIVRREVLEIHLSAGPAAGVATSRTVGRVGGESLRASEPVFGGYGGLDVFWRPKRESKVQLHFGASAMRLLDPGAGECVDCDVPFGESFGLGRVQIGLVFGWPVAPRPSTP